MGKNLSTLASLAFAAGQPGETPTDAALTALARTGDEEVPIATLASLRRLVFEAQLLMTAQVKQLIEQRTDDQSQKDSVVLLFAMRRSVRMVHMTS